MLLCAGLGTYWFWEKMVQFSWFFTVIEANIAIWGKKPKPGNFKATKDYSQWETASFLSPFLLPLPSIHFGIFLRWLSLPHPLVMEELLCTCEGMCIVKIPWGLTWSFDDGCVMCFLPLAEGISPPLILPPLHFISVLGTAEEKVEMEMLGHYALRLGYKKSGWKQNVERIEPSSTAVCS